jgi:hypothetical protein
MLLRNVTFLRCLGVALLTLAWAIRYSIARRRFYRRTMGGLEWFPSFRQSVITRMFEGLAGFLAKIFIWIGILMLLYTIL